MASDAFSIIPGDRPPGALGETAYEPHSFLEKRTPTLYAEYWKEGVDPLIWHKQWTPLTIEAMGVTELDGHGLTDTRGIAWAWSERAEHQLCLTGSSHVDNRVIRLIEDKAAPQSGALFSEFFITLTASDENQRMGAFYHVDEALEPFSENYQPLCIGCVVPLATLRQMVGALATLTPGDAMLLDFQVHCFRRDGEVAAPGIFEEYALEKGKAGYAFLEEFRVEA